MPIVRFLIHDKPLLVLLALAVLAGLLEAATGLAVTFLFVLLVIGYVITRLASRPLADFIARLRYSIKWKIGVAIGVMTLVFVGATLFSVEAMDFMHTELHEIQALAETDPAAALTAVNDLEQAQHGFVFSFAPLFALLGALVAAALGVAISISIVEPVRRMGEAMRRIASGDFTEPLIVSNRDELGELADRINTTAADLARLREATAEDERARALRERIVQVTAAQEDERRRISRELHDGLGPSLAALANRARECGRHVDTDPALAKVELDEITEALRGHIQEIRSLIHELRPLSVDQLGLLPALRQQVERFAGESGSEVLCLLPSELQTDTTGEVALFRVLQESLSNIRQHAGAQRVEVVLHNVDGGVDLTIRDDGRGFDASGPINGLDSGAGGIGLSSMRERAELAGGRLMVQSGASGSTVTLFVPHAEAQMQGEVDVGADPRPVG